MREPPFSLFLCTLSICILSPIWAEVTDWRKYCNSLPRQDFLKAQQIDFVCSHFEHYQKDIQNEVFKKAFSHPTENQLNYLRDIERCSRTDCTKDTRRKKRATDKNIRREIRMMTPQQREDVWTAMNALKSRIVDNITAWDLHTLVHYPDSAPGAHWGPAFLPWHREFLKQFEIALQREVPGVTLPFWDSTLDEGLPEPSDSILWTEELMGNGNGYVKTGPFKDWETNVLMPLSQIPVKRLYRMTGGRPQDRLMNLKDVDWITNRPKFQDLVFCHDSTFESIHGLSHVWVGGFMFVIRVSPNDPSFYMHHAFIDSLWERFRQNRQDRWQRENDWSEKTCNKRHELYAQMKPFGMTNRDGLSNNYTDFWYEYEPIRHCTYELDYCDSQYLWCDTSAWRCRSKVVFGGNCTGFDETPICFNSVCIEGKCQLPPQIMHNRKSIVSTEPMRMTDRVWTKTVLLDPLGNGVSQELASVTVIDHTNGDNTTVYLHEHVQYPELPGLVYIPIPKPRQGIVQNVTLLAQDGFGRYCQAQCYNDTVERYQVCQPHLSVSASSDTSSPISYTHSITTRSYLDVDLSLHPRHLLVSMPYIVFSCSRKLMTSAMITALPSLLRPPQTHDPLVWFRVTVHQSDVSQNLQIEVSPMDDSSQPWLSSIKRAASPYDPSLVFVQAPNPSLHPNGIRVKVSILENGDRIMCVAKCTLEDGSTTRCDGSIELHSDAGLSDESVFSADQSALPVLGWNMRGHPATWRHKVPYLTYYC